MPTTHRLRTMVQISDLHLGSIEPVTGDALGSRPAAQRLAPFSWWDGVLGHHGRTLQDLEAFDSGLVNDGEDPLLMVSGDVTRYGDGVELATANDFLASQPNLHPPQGNYIGLRDPPWSHVAIPGHHDHWPGPPVIFGGPPPASRAYGPPLHLPYIRDLRFAHGRLWQLVGIHTDNRPQHPRCVRRVACGSRYSAHLDRPYPRFLDEARRPAGPSCSDSRGVPVRHHNPTRPRPLCLANMFGRLSAEVMARTYAAGSPPV
jgi:hypothetical protein